MSIFIAEGVVVVEGLKVSLALFRTRGVRALMMCSFPASGHMQRPDTAG